MSHDLTKLRQRYLRQQQASLDELCKLADPAKALRELIRELHRQAPIELSISNRGFAPLIHTIEQRPACPSR